MTANKKINIDDFTAHCCDRLQIDPHADNAAEQLHEILETLLESHNIVQEEEYIQSKDLQRLESYLEQIIHDMKSIQRSRAWRIGYKAMSLAKRILGRKTSGDGFTHIDAVIERYEHWKKARA